MGGAVGSSGAMRPSTRQWDGVAGVMRAAGVGPFSATAIGAAWISVALSIVPEPLGMPNDATGIVCAASAAQAAAGSAPSVSLGGDWACAEAAVSDRIVSGSKARNACMRFPRSDRPEFVAETQTACPRDVTHEAVWSNCSTDRRGINRDVCSWHKQTSTRYSRMSAFGGKADEASGHHDHGQGHLGLPVCHRAG